MKVLITYGGTREPIDSVRYIGNFSTGKTGEVISDFFIARGDLVTVIKPKHLSSPAGCHKAIDYFSFDDLSHALFSEIKANKYDAIIHAAAVSDYKVSKITSNDSTAKAIGGKLNSGQSLQLFLEPTPKLISRLKDISENKKILVVGFKLTEKATEEQKADAVRNIFTSGADIVVQNDLSDIDPTQHICQIFTSVQNNVITKNKRDLASKLYSLIKENL